MVLFSVWFFFGSPLTGVFQELLYEASVIDMFHGAWMLYCLYCLSKVLSMRYMIMWLDFSLGLFGNWNLELTRSAYLLLFGLLG